MRRVIGTRARALRDTAGARQDDVASAARTYGLAWTRGKVAALESGNKSISAEELTLLPAVLSEACGRQVTVAELLDSDEEVWLSPVAYVGHARHIAATLESRPRNYIGVETPGMRASADTFKEARDRVRELGYHDTLKAPTLAQWGEIAGWSGEADIDAARKLGEPRLVVNVASWCLWGRSLTTERDRRVGEHDGVRGGALRARRGHVTRGLLAELRGDLERRKERAGHGR